MTSILANPPFPYLLDIVIATIDCTGFGKGLYSGDELSYIKLHEHKDRINFLVKLIALTERAASCLIKV